jgi:hypothetical protein
MEENKLPIKTKIAAWWILVIGLFGMITSVIAGLPALIIFLFLPSLFFFLFPFIFLSKRKKWAWWFSVITQFTLIISPFIPLWRFIVVLNLLNFLNKGFYSMLRMLFPLRLGYDFPIISILLVLPFILLLLDRKNFFKVAS